MVIGFHPSSIQLKLLFHQLFIFVFTLSFTNWWNQSEAWEVMNKGMDELLVFVRLLWAELLAGSPAYNPPLKEKTNSSIQSTILCWLHSFHFSEVCLFWLVFLGRSHWLGAQPLTHPKDNKTKLHFIQLIPPLSLFSQFAPPGSANGKKKSCLAPQLACLLLWLVAYGALRS